jgi:hypothetical protein
MCHDCATTRTCAICNKTICSRHTGQRRIRKCERCDRHVCLQHYKSVRKHECFKEIKKEREEAAKERLKLIEGINAHRAKIAERGVTPVPEEPQQDVSSVESVRGSTYNEPILLKVRYRAAQGERPDNRTPEDIARDLAQGEEAEAARERAERLGIDEAEITGPSGWA